MRCGAGGDSKDEDKNVDGNVDGNVENGDGDETRCWGRRKWN